MARRPYFAKAGKVLGATYADAADLTRLSDINALFLERLAGLLGIQARLVPQSSASHALLPDPTERLIEICQSPRRDAVHFGPGGARLHQAGSFEAAGISLGYANYAGYPTYDQGMEVFEHGVSIDRYADAVRAGRAVAFEVGQQTGRLSTGVSHQPAFRRSNCASDELKPVARPSFKHFFRRIHLAATAHDAHRQQ